MSNPRPPRKPAAARSKSRPSRTLGSFEENTARPCSVDGCGHSRVRWSRFCETHVRRFLATGHPEGRPINRKAWGPWVRFALVFVKEQAQAGHPGILGALRWIEDEMAMAADIPRYANYPAGSSPATRRRYLIALLAHRHRGTTPSEMLARFIAAFAADEDRGTRHALFRDDHHQRVAAMKLLLRGKTYVPDLPHPPLHWSFEAASHKGTPLGRHLTHLAWSRWNGALGVLALRAGEDLQARIIDKRARASALEPRGTIPGSRAPFAVPAPTTSTHQDNTSPPTLASIRERGAPTNTNNHQGTSQCPKT